MNHTRSQNNNKFLTVTLGLIAALLLCSSVTGFISLPHIYYYGALLVFGVLLLATGRGLHIGSRLMCFFLLICAMSLLINHPPSYFRAWQRLGWFVIVSVIVGPILVSYKAYEIRRLLFAYIMSLCVVLSVGSLICYFLGINFFVRNDEILAIEAGHFSGLYNHSMILGPLSGMAAIYAFCRYLSNSKKSIWLLTVSICCIASTFLSASRAALGGCMIGLVVVYINYNRNHLTRGLLVGLVIIGVIAATYPIWGDLTDFVVAKHKSNVESGGAFYSRDSLWQTRLYEIRNNPITGVGFCCVDEGLSYVNKETGVIEPGSSWLAVFSMTGVFGFLSFLLLFLKSFRRVRALPNSTESSLLNGCLSFYAFHLIFEGYVLAVGSVLGMIYWLLLGCVWGNKQEHSTR